MKRRCLIIDNDDQNETIESLIRLGQKEGIAIECEQFNVGSTFEDGLLNEEKQIDISKVVSEYKRRYKGKMFHLAAFDWDLSDDMINGVELIRQLEHYKILRNTPKLLYSGLLEDKLSLKLDEYKSGELNKAGLMHHLKTLIKIDIKNFVEREDYDQEIISILRSSDESLDFIVEDELAKYPELIFHNRFVSNSFNNKTFLEISQLLENDDRLRNDFKREILQQTLAYLTQMI